MPPYEWHNVFCKGGSHEHSSMDKVNQGRSRTRQGADCQIDQKQMLFMLDRCKNRILILHFLVS